MPVNVLLYGEVIPYLVIVFMMELFSGRRVRSAEDFLLAGGRLGVVLLTFTLAATRFGGGMVMEEIEHGALHGTLGGVWYGVSCAMEPLALSFIAPGLS